MQHLNPLRFIAMLVFSFIAVSPLRCVPTIVHLIMIGVHGIISTEITIACGIILSIVVLHGCYGGLFILRKRMLGRGALTRRRSWHHWMLIMITTMSSIFWHRVRVSEVWCSQSWWNHVWHHHLLGVVSLAFSVKLFNRNVAIHLNNLICGIRRILHLDLGACECLLLLIPTKGDMGIRIGAAVARSVRGDSRNMTSRNRKSKTMNLLGIIMHERRRRRFFVDSGIRVRIWHDCLKGMFSSLLAMTRILLLRSPHVICLRSWNHPVTKIRIIPIKLGMKVRWLHLAMSENDGESPAIHSTSKAGILWWSFQVFG